MHEPGRGTRRQLAFWSDWCWQESQKAKPRIPRIHARNDMKVMTSIYIYTYMLYIHVYIYIYILTCYIYMYIYIYIMHVDEMTELDVEREWTVTCRPVTWFCWRFCWRSWAARFAFFIIGLVSIMLRSSPSESKSSCSSLSSTYVSSSSVCSSIDLNRRSESFLAVKYPCIIMRYDKNFG